MINREEAKKILGEGATEEQVTNFLNNYHNVEKSKNEEINTLRSQLEKYSDYDTIKQKLSDIERANMTEQEKLENMKKETEANYKKAQRIYNTAKAKEILAGYDMADEDIEMLVSDDEQKTIANATRMKTKFDTYKENVARKTKEDIMSQNIQPDMTDAIPKETKMTFDKFAELSSEEQEKFINEHPDEFEEM